MADEIPAIRIGDAERDQALQDLQEHLAAGRLAPTEFDERVGQALAARTQPDLDALFRDLPPLSSTRTPALSDPTPATGTGKATPERRRMGRSWWLAIPLIVAAMISREWWIMIPALAIIFWAMSSSPAPQEQPRETLTAAELSLAQRREITDLVNSGQKIQAIKRYRELTGADLKGAKIAIETWQGQLDR